MKATTRNNEIARLAIAQLHALIDGKIDRVQLPQPSGREQRAAPIQYSIDTEQPSCGPLARVQDVVGGKYRKSRNGADYLLFPEQGLMLLYRSRARSFCIFEGFGTPRFRLIADKILGEVEASNAIIALLSI